MTYAFEWQHSDVDAKDTEKVEELRKKHMETAKMAVEKGIEAIRRYVYCSLLCCIVFEKMK